MIARNLGICGDHNLLRYAFCAFVRPLELAITSARCLGSLKLEQAFINVTFVTGSPILNQAPTCPQARGLVAAEAEAPKDGLREPPELHVKLATVLGFHFFAHHKCDICDAAGLTNVTFEGTPRKWLTLLGGL